MVEDLFLDRQGGNPSNMHKLDLDRLNKIKQINDLVDIWRKKKIQIQDYSLFLITVNKFTVE